MSEKKLIQFTVYEEIGIGSHNPWAMWTPPGCLMVVDERPEDQEEDDAGVAQSVERNLAKVEVEGSRPFTRSRIRAG